MLSDEMTGVEVKVTAGDVTVVLQVIARAAAQGVIRDNEMALVGGTREKLVAAMQEATGVNFDQARAAQARAMQQAQQKAAQEAQAAAAAQADAANQEAPAEEAPAEVVMAEEAPAAAPVEEAPAE